MLKEHLFRAMAPKIKRLLILNGNIGYGCCKVFIPKHKEEKPIYLC